MRGSRRSGDPYDLAREDNPGKWTKRLLLEREAEKQRFCEQLAKEVRSGLKTGLRLSASEIHEKIRCFIRGQRSVRSDRALNSAQARDRIDSWFAMLKEEAQRLKKTDADFQDVDLLVFQLEPVIKALEEYEKLAEPSFFDPRPLNELANFVFTVSLLSRLMGPMNRNRNKMALVRAQKSSKSQDRYRLAEEQARALRERRPNLSPRAMALLLAPKVGLQPGTLEKHFGKVFRARQ
jgi:hypothetical protein